ncbi:MAG: hypothetical protein ACLFWB_11500 [Armatimonadota bacterium]
MQKKIRSILSGKKRCCVTVLDGDIIISSSTRNLLGDEAEVEEVGNVARPPHGRQEPVFFLRDLIKSSQEESQ